MYNRNQNNRSRVRSSSGSNSSNSSSPDNQNTNTPNNSPSSSKSRSRIPYNWFRQSNASFLSYLISTLCVKCILSISLLVLILVSAFTTYSFLLRRESLMGIGHNDSTASLIMSDVLDNHATSIVTVTATATAIRNGSTDDSSKRACRVIIKNKVDYHHEVIESAVLRYPLPWHTFNCATSLPIIYDFALYQNRFDLKISAESTTLSKRAKYLNETEFWGWKTYFEHNLKGKTFDRYDTAGSEIETKAYFNELVSYEDMNNSPIDAQIEISCDVSSRFVTWLKEDEDAYCILHGANKESLGRYPQALNRSCFLSPMWPENQCKFLASDLPKFDNEERKKTGGVEICLQGNNNNITMATEIFSKIPFEQYNATFHISGRNSQRRIRRIMHAYQNIEPHVIFSAEKDYVNFFKMLSRCDIVMPMKEPSEPATHYPWGDKKSSGIIPGLAAYKIPAVMHKEYANIYKHWLTAPWEEYDDTIDGKVDALTKMLIRVHKEKMNVI